MKKNLTLNTLKITEPVRTPRVSLEYLVKPLPLAPSDVETVHMAIKEMELRANPCAVTLVVRIWSAHSPTLVPVKRVTLDTTATSLCADQTAKTKGSV